MQTTIRKVGQKTSKTNEKSNETKDTTSQDEKHKKSSHTLSTPRSFVQKSSTTDIYSQAKTKMTTKAPKKAIGSSIAREPSPMKGLLKSSPSSTSQISTRTMPDKRPSIQGTPRIKKPTEAKAASNTVRKPSVGKTGKDLPILNVTVNSPPVKRRLDNDFKKYEKNSSRVEVDKKEAGIVKSGAKEIDKESSKKSAKEVERQRQKTRTLNETEAKVIKESIDNNAEMLNLSRKLTATPKAFFVGLDGDTAQPKPAPSKSSEDEVSYEDDFESYESDFESEHSSASETQDSDDSEEERDSGGGDGVEGGSESKKDEERMLDSGSFELAPRPPFAPLSHIREEGERPSLDEGFQEDSVRSVAHVDVLDRPLFIDFKKSKDNKRKRQIQEKLQQRAKDLLTMIQLHEMSYTLFEMKPIPYDLYMATFGRLNYTQTSVQTFEDGITEEVQTDEIFFDNKWSQFPVKFSKNEVCLTEQKKRSNMDEDYLKKFTFLLTEQKVEVKLMKNINNEYKLNPLRILLDQRNGVGGDGMLPYESYETKLKNTDFNVDRLRKFLKKSERRINNILTVNSGDKTTLDLIKTKLPFSKGYITLEYENLPKHPYLKYRKVTAMAFSETKSNLLMTVHTETSSIASMEKSLVCLWDIGVASREPLKILVAIDNITLCRFRGSTDGIFVGALEDGSIHLWDLSEEPTILKSVASDNKESTNLVEFNTEGMPEAEISREWNLRNSKVDYNTEETPALLQSCAYTSSALRMREAALDCAVGLEVCGGGGRRGGGGDAGIRALGQVCSLQQSGLLSIWTIIQDRSKNRTRDPGQAYWSKMKLERIQNISLIQHIDAPIRSTEKSIDFNLESAKRRLAAKKHERSILKKEILKSSAANIGSSRPHSAANRESSRPNSAANLQDENSVLPDNCENGILCTDLKVLRWDKVDYYLVAKNRGEVLVCTLVAGGVKVNAICVSRDLSTITCLAVSASAPYFLAATRGGTAALCRLAGGGAVLTLDTRNVPQSPQTEQSDRCAGDHKGRYIGSVPVKPANSVSCDQLDAADPITCILWPRHDPCAIVATCAAGAHCWDLRASDIYARSVADTVECCAAADGNVALLTKEGLQIHRVLNEQNSLEVFLKYAALL